MAEEMKKEEEKKEAEKLDLNDLDAVSGGGDPYAQYTGQDNEDIDDELKKKI